MRGPDGGLPRTLAADEPLPLSTEEQVVRAQRRQRDVPEDSDTCRRRGSPILGEGMTPASEKTSWDVLLRPWTRTSPMRAGPTAGGNPALR